MNNPIKIVGLSGSLRKDSFNTGLLRTLNDILPAQVELEILDIGHLPLFNQDFESDLPETVKELKAKIKAADAIIFSGPEYNYSLSGVLKNAIDWASRPYGDNSFAGKPAGIIGGSAGNTASARMQYHLRQIMVFLDMYPLNKPEIMIPMIQEKFDKQGKLIDEKTKEKLSEFIEALVAWTKKLNK